jgi:hypothetical protein
MLHYREDETSVTETNRKINTALNSVMTACGLVGESGTEILFDVLHEAIAGVHKEWWIVEQSHNEGLGFDVNALLADQIEADLVLIDKPQAR